MTRDNGTLSLLCSEHSISILQSRAQNASLYADGGHFRVFHPPPDELDDSVAPPKGNEGGSEQGIHWNPVHTEH